MQAVFLKKFYVSQICVSCFGSLKSLHFPWNIQWSRFLHFDSTWNKDRERFSLIFLALKVEKARGSIRIDCDGWIVTLDRHNFCHKSQLRNSEINITHDALFFECSNIMKFISPYQLRKIWVLFVKVPQRYSGSISQISF